MEHKYQKDLQVWYKKMTQKDIDLSNPQTFNEKIQWLKLYDSTPIKTQLTDKYLVRDWIKEKIGSEYLIPLLGVYDNFDEINFDELPNKFIIKCNHGSGYNIIVRNKNNLDKQDAKQKINKWMSENFAFHAGYELHYFNIKPKIIIEKFIEEIEQNLYDYRFLCFDGKVEQIWLDINSGTQEHKRNIYDTHWNKLDVRVKWPEIEETILKPDNLTEMIKLAEILSKNFCMVRVDLFNVNNKIYFGEMTFTSMSGLGEFYPPNWDYTLGKMIKLPKRYFDVDNGKYYNTHRILNKVFSIAQKNNKIIYKICGIKFSFKNKKK